MTEGNGRLRVCRYCGEEFAGRRTVGGYIDECDDCFKGDWDAPPIRAWFDPRDSAEDGSPGIVAALAYEDRAGRVWVEMGKVRDGE